MEWYIKEFLRNPRDIGAIAATGKTAVTRYIQLVDIHSRSKILELGSAAGGLTKHVEKHLKPDQKYLAIEIDQRLVDKFQKRFPHLQIRCGDVKNLAEILRDERFEKPDCIFSALPWTNFNSTHQKKLLREVYECMETGAVFTSIAYFYGPWLPTGKNFQKLLKDTFGNLEISPLVWKNMPPAYIYRCYK